MALLTLAGEPVGWIIHIIGPGARSFSKSEFPTGLKPMHKPHVPRYSLSLYMLVVFALAGCQGDAVSVGPAEPGDVIFTEVMPELKSADSSWLELFNNTDKSIKLDQCVISNSKGQELDLAHLHIAAAGQYVAAHSADANLPGLSDIASLSYPADAFQLNADETLVLTCGGRTVDQISYQVNSPTTSDRVRSWQLHLNPAEPRRYTSEANWCHILPLEKYEYSLDRFATPGFSNSICDSNMPFAVFDDQASVLIEGVDLEATLKVAQAEFARKSATSELVIWGIRDQVITPAVARKISEMYFANIEMLYDTQPFLQLDWNHAVWHFAWAISNLYRNGDSAVKRELQAAYEDALRRPETLDRNKYIAAEYIHGERIVMGDMHTPAHNRMRELIVAPTNPSYISSYEEYLKNRRSPVVTMGLHYFYLVAVFFSEVFE